MQFIFTKEQYQVDTDMMKKYATLLHNSEDFLRG